MEKNVAKGVERIAVAVLALALLTGGCSEAEGGPSAQPGPPQSPPTQTQDPPTQTQSAQAEEERLSVQRAAEEALDGYRWPRESVWKDILGEEVEFILYHGNGWTIHVPAAWEQIDGSTWEAPSQHARFSVSKYFLGVNDPKWYRAQQGAWRHETSYAPPFDYYYDDDGGYTPPAGSADYIYFFAPAGESESYELTLQTVVEETSEAEGCIQEAMLLSFCLDESSHVLNSGAYTPGKTEWEAAMAGLAAETQRLWFFIEHDGELIELEGKGTPDRLSHALLLGDFRPEEFVETYFGEKPADAEVQGEETITLSLPGLRIWLYFFDHSPWVCVHHSGEDYWARVYHKDDPDQTAFDTVRTWMEAESAWAGGDAESLNGSVP